MEIVAQVLVLVPVKLCCDQSRLIPPIKPLMDLEENGTCTKALGKASISRWKQSWTSLKCVMMMIIMKKHTYPGTH